MDLPKSAPSGGKSQLNQTFILARVSLTSMFHVYAKVMSFQRVKAEEFLQNIVTQNTLLKWIPILVEVHF